MANITIDEAARYLNVSTRTISTYISQGIITYHKKQGSNRKYISADELQQLKESKECGDFSVKNYKRLQARVRRLEAQMEVLLKIIDTDSVKLGLSPDDGRDLLVAANDTLDTTLSVDHVEAWLPILMSLDEFDLESIQKGARTDKPWYPFLSLCVALIVFVTGNKNYNIDLQLQMHHKELAEARRRLRLSALIFIESRGPKIEVDNLVTARPNTVVETIKKSIKSRHN